MLECKVSFHIGKKYSTRHNLRNYDMTKWNKDGHIDESRMQLNKVYGNPDLLKFFEETFGDALLEFNDKNESKHPERLIGYVPKEHQKLVQELGEDAAREECKKRAAMAYLAEQKGKVQEAIIQLGDHEEYMQLVEQLGKEKADEFYKKSLQEAYEKWVEENPSMKVFCAAIHMDETRDGTPHIHIDFLPVGTAEKGLKIKVSMDGATRELGFKRTAKNKYDSTPYKQWIVDRRLKLEEHFQSIVNEFLGTDVVKILPSEPTVTQHRGTSEWKSEQSEKKAMLQKVADFTTRKGFKKIEAAEQIIDNARKVNKALCDEGQQRIIVAKVEEEKAKRAKMAAEEAEKKSIAAEEAAIAKKDELQKLVQRELSLLKKKIILQDITIEQEVQRRLSPYTFPTRVADEDRRYLERIRKAFGIETQRERGNAAIQAKREVLRDLKHTERDDI